jgi:hypothetical protein
MKLYQINTQLRDLKMLQNVVQFIKEKVRKIEETPNKSCYATIERRCGYIGLETNQSLHKKHRSNLLQNRNKCSVTFVQV